MQLQKEMIGFEEELSQAVNEIWAKRPEADGELQITDSWAARMQEHEKRQATDALEKVAKPEIIRHGWNMRLSALR